MGRCLGRGNSVSKVKKVRTGLPCECRHGIETAHVTAAQGSRWKVADETSGRGDQVTTGFEKECESIQSVF